jgi:hypothetical protein
VSEEKKYTEAEAHRYFGVSLNNKTWEWLGKENRTPEEDELMLHGVHTSCYHWMQIGAPVNHTRGEWMVSHVYAVLNKPVAALEHARRTLEICQQHNIGDFDIAYAYEAMARALAANGQLEEAKKYHDLAEKAGADIKEEEDKKIWTGDFEAQPWYGLK